MSVHLESYKVEGLKKSNFIKKLLYPNLEENRELDETPARAAKALLYMTNGFNMDP